ARCSIRATAGPSSCCDRSMPTAPGQTPDRIIPEIIVRALRRQELKMTQGHQTREFNFVEDIAKGFVLAATAPADVEGQILNLGCGEEVSMRHVAQTILDLMGNPI